MLEAKHERFDLRRFDTRVPGPYIWADRAVRTADGGKVMNGLYLIAGLIALGLFIYLVLALLKPEWFG